MEAEEMMAGIASLLRGESLEAGDAQLDVERVARQGIPEVVLAPGKGERLMPIVAALAAATGQALASRLEPAEAAALEAWALAEGLTVARYGRGALRLADARRPRPALDGEVHLFCAGASDIPALDEARMVVEAVGLRTAVATDCGVAGIHRLRRPIDRARDSADAVVVAAGMDGALPSVVAGLVDVPVIGLPVSSGYGLGGRGVSALLSMLQGCVPGLTVVNIDNGVGAGAAAALVARRAALARAGGPAQG